MCVVLWWRNQTRAVKWYSQLIKPKQTWICSYFHFLFKITLRQRNKTNPVNKNYTWQVDSLSRKHTSRVREKAQCSHFDRVPALQCFPLWTVPTLDGSYFYIALIFAPSPLMDSSQLLHHPVQTCKPSKSLGPLERKLPAVPRPVSSRPHYAAELPAATLSWMC